MGVVILNKIWLIKVCLEFVLVIYKYALANCAGSLKETLSEFFWKKNFVLAGFIQNGVTPLEQKNEWVNECVTSFQMKSGLKFVWSLFQWFRNLLWRNVWTHRNKLQMNQILFVMSPIRSSFSLYSVPHNLIFFCVKLLLKQ